MTNRIPGKKVKPIPGSALKTVAERKRLQREYNDRKIKVMEREKTNDRMVILFRDNGDWWKIVGRSVIYYTRIIVPRIRGKDVQVWNDDDFVAQSKEGEIRVPNLEKFFEEVERIGYKVEKPNEDYAYVKLNNKITEEELNRLRKENEHIWGMTEKILQPVVMWPTLKAESIILLRMIWEQTRKMDAPQRALLGDALAKQMIDVVLCINNAAHGFCSPKEALECMKEHMGRVDGYMLIVVNLRLFNVARIYDLTTQMEKVKKIIARELKISEKKDAEDK